jgi:diadenosine tetraphosphate (Ap4A) HIT family hydrolase
MNVDIDPRITSSSFQIDDWPVSRLFLKNNVHYPWFILVPRIPNIREFDELPDATQLIVLQEINALSKLIKIHFQPDKLNIAMLGNIVSQLHIHAVARSTSDPLWPHSIWQENQPSEPYLEDEIQALISTLKVKIEPIKQTSFFHCNTSESSS